jgi:type VI secretion system protein VasJ
MSDNAGGIPVSAAAPAGSPVRGDARFDELQAEIDAGSAVSSSPKTTDWHKVVTLADDLLRNQGKDILVASWLGAGLLRLNGIEGIAMGAEILADLCQLYWPDMQPPAKRLHARCNALNWWQEQAEYWLENNDERAPLAPDLQQRLLTQLERLDKILQPQDVNDEIHLWGLINAVQKLPVIEEAAPAAPSAPLAKTEKALPEKKAAGKAAETPPAAAFDNSTPLNQIIADCSKMCLSAADIILTNNSSDPASYALRRALLWGSLQKLPPAENNRTLLPAPPEHILTGLVNLAGIGNFVKVLQTAELQVGVYLYWLDLSACSARALTALGDSHALARLALEGQVQALLHKFPQLTAMTFDDNTPFANADTQAWLKGLSAGPQQNQDAGVTMFNTDGLPPLQAMALLEDALAKNAAGRVTLAIYSAMCQVAQRGEFWNILLALSDKIMNLADTYQISAFDPAFTVKTLIPVYEALNAFIARDQTSSRARQQLQRVLACLSCLQPTMMLNAAPSGAAPRPG